MRDRLVKPEDFFVKPVARAIDVAIIILLYIWIGWWALLVASLPPLLWTYYKWRQEETVRFMNRLLSRRTAKR